MKSIKSIFLYTFLLFLFLIILLSNLVSGESKKEIFNGLLSPESNFSIESSTVIKIPLIYKTRALIFINDTGYTIDKGLCEVQGLYTICLTGIETTLPKYINQEETYKAKITISRFLAGLEVKKEMFPAILEIGDEASSTITVTNTGSIKAENISVVESIPNQFQVTELSGIGCFYYDDKIALEGELREDASRACAYRIKALGNITFKLKTNSSYFNGLSTVKNTPIETELTVYPEPMLFALSFDRVPSALGEKFNIKSSISNIHHAKEINVLAYEIKIPDGIKVEIIPQKFKIGYNQFTWSGFLYGNQSESFETMLSVSDYGSHNITFKVTYLTNNQRKEFSEGRVISIENPNKKSSIIEEHKAEKNTAVQANLTLISDSAESNSSIDKAQEPLKESITKETITIGRNSSSIKTIILIVGGGILALILLISIIAIIKKHNANSKAEVEHFRKNLNNDIEKVSGEETNEQHVKEQEKTSPKKMPRKKLEDDLITTKADKPEGKKEEQVNIPDIRESKKEKPIKPKAKSSTKGDSKSSFRF